MTQKFDARKVIEYINELETEVILYSEKAERLHSAYDGYVGNNSFEGESADAAKALVQEVEKKLLDEVIDSHKYLLQLYYHMMNSFSAEVDSADDARIELEALNQINVDYRKKSEEFQGHAESIENIARTIQSKYGHLGTVTVPNFTPAKEAFENLCGSYGNTGFISQTIENFKEFDDRETIYVKDMDLDGYLDNVEAKIDRLTILLDDAKVFVDDYKSVNFFINQFKNGTVFEHTLSSRVFSWLESAEGENLRALVKSPFYKLLKKRLILKESEYINRRDSFKFIAEEIDLFGKELKKHSMKFVDGYYEKVPMEFVRLTMGSFGQMLTVLSIPAAMFPNSEYTKIYGTGADCTKRFIKGGQTCLVDSTAAIFSMPKQLSNLIDDRDNIVISATDYLRHNKLKTVDEDVRRRVKSIVSNLDNMAKVAVGDLSVKVESMSIGDWSEAVGYVAAMVALAAVGGEIAEAIRGVEPVTVGTEAAEDAEVIVEGTEVVEETEIVVKSEKIASGEEVLKNPFDDFDAVSATNKQKGNFGEYTADYNLLQNKSLKEAGYDLESIGRPAPSSLDDKIRKGIDGLYKNNNPDSNIKYVIDESKFGQGKLSKTRDGLQMSDSWLYGDVSGNNRILEAVQDDYRLSRDIDRALKNNRVERVLSHIDADGKVITYRLDCEGKIIGEWP